MKESVKIESKVLDSVRKRIKTTGQTIGGFIELAAEKELTKKSFEAPESSGIFRKYLDNRGIKYKALPLSTIIYNEDPWGIAYHWAGYLIRLFNKPVGHETELK
jgi:hypothetical protein